MNRESSDAGFTLIEALVAMAILAVGAVSLLTAAEGNTARVAEITERTAARWAAQHALTAMQLGEPVSSADVYGIAFDIRIETTGTDDASLSAVLVVVSPADTSSAAFILDGYTSSERVE